MQQKSTINNKNPVKIIIYSSRNNAVSNELFQNEKNLFHFSFLSYVLSCIVLFSQESAKQIGSSPWKCKNETTVRHSVETGRTTGSQAVSLRETKLTKLNYY